MPRGIRVMQSFRAPRPTTNPYIVQLDRALAETSGVEHLRFSWPTALLGRVDVIHFHWPEAALEGSQAWKRAVKRLRMRALLLRLRLTRTALVRTTHNLDLPEVDRATARLLEKIEERTDLRILLNDSTRPRWSSPTAVVPHGHYIDWYGPARTDAVADTLAFVGLVRRYKGVEGLIQAFRDTRTEAPGLRLTISGNPTGSTIRDAVEESASADHRIHADLRFLSDDDFAHAVTGAQGVVLPYLFMHNSGTALAALSLQRPILVPRNEVNEALAHEVGPGWVHLFEGEITAADLISFGAATARHPAAPPDLSRRGWHDAGRAHADAYLRAVQLAR